MEPTNFNKARWHYCQIFTALTSDDAVKAGVISERNVKPLLFFFMRVWDNDKIRHWLAPKEPEEVKEKNFMILVGWLYGKSTVFSTSTYAASIASLLMNMNVLGHINKSKSIKTYFCLSMPKDIQTEVYSIYSDLF